MSRLQRVLSGARRPLVIPFVTAGFPELHSTLGIVTAIAEAGADMIELGVPFSDPLADGPTIQRSSERALANGVTVAWVFDTVAKLRAQPATAQVPLILMGYCNPMFHYGLERFLDDAFSAGVDGLIVPDLPPEEAREYRQGCAQRGIAAVFLVAPNAPDERIVTVDRASTHFSYCVTITGVTGARADIQARTVAFLQRVRALAKKPFVVGFGVRGAEHVLALGPYADGVVVGSALIEILAQAADPAAAAAAKVAQLRAAADQVAGGSEDAAEERQP